MNISPDLIPSWRGCIKTSSLGPVGRFDSADIEVIQDLVELFFFSPYSFLRFMTFLTKPSVLPPRLTSLDDTVFPCPSLNTASNTYIESLQEVEKQQGSCHLQIPVESLERLDNEYEQNPEFFSQELMQRCRNQSGQLGTRVQGIKLVNETIAKGWPGGAMPVGVVAAGGAEGETVKAPSGVARPGSKVVGVHPGAQRRVLPRMDENGTRGS
ncbi:unnamed protein product [Choristocarpus tenellus]